MDQDVRAVNFVPCSSGWSFQIDFAPGSGQDSVQPALSFRAARSAAIPIKPHNHVDGSGTAMMLSTPDNIKFRSRLSIVLWSWVCDMEVRGVERAAEAIGEVAARQCTETQRRPWASRAYDTIGAGGASLSGKSRTS
jgi:hypothetical protein